MDDLLNRVKESLLTRYGLDVRGIYYEDDEYPTEICFDIDPSLPDISIDVPHLESFGEEVDKITKDFVDVAIRSLTFRINSRNRKGCASTTCDAYSGCSLTEPAVTKRFKALLNLLYSKKDI